jgi:hypothetical protein
VTAYLAIASTGLPGRQLDKPGIAKIACRLPTHSEALRSVFGIDLKEEIVY